MVTSDKPESSASVSGLVDSFFRDQYQSTVLYLTKTFGSENLDLIENATQDAMLRAMRTWPEHGVPDHPDAWIRTVARNRVVDELRRIRVRREKQNQVVEDALALKYAGPVRGFAGYEDDDVLKMMFVCCHPKIPVKAQLALVLRYLCGFGTPEIGKALLTREEAVRKLLTRSKKKIATEGLAFEFPPDRELGDRLQNVLRSLYLLFNEGYSPHFGTDTVRPDLCAEALRLIRLLARTSVDGRGQIHALAALMMLQAARLPARMENGVEIVTLERQDRQKWDDVLVAEGFSHLEQSMKSKTRSSYHLQAGIAACHIQAKRYSDTDWVSILSLYDQLRVLEPSPVVELNRAVAVSEVHGFESALTLLDSLSEQAEMRDYHLLPAVRAHFLEKLGRIREAASEFARAVGLAQSEPQRRFLEERMSSCQFDYTREGKAHRP